MFIDLPITLSLAWEPFDVADLTCLLVWAAQVVVVGTIRLTENSPLCERFISTIILSLFTDLCPASARMGLATPLPCWSTTGDLTTTQTLLKLLLM